ncbi:MAG: SDR family oxidoreductase [Verrucomicrobia bacterium]|nr:SDR family oxidoreductase [Verrucomicrobiota bacterium]
MDLGLKDRVLLVSGGARGIGAATVRMAAAEGMRVAWADRDDEAGRALLAEIPDGCFIEGDLSDDAVCAHAIATTVKSLGRLDVLVNNAGVNDSVPLTAPPAEFLASLRRNLLPAFALTHGARPHLVAAHGAIVNLSSKVATTGQGRTSGYAASKGAIEGLTREWALALAPEGVRVNCVIPAECDTDQYRRWFASQPDPVLARSRVESLVPLGRRLTTADEMASAILWLASPRAGHITGQFLFVDGGYTHLDRAASSAHAW